MSLYGDLPPIEGQNDAQDISNGWAKPKLNNITRKPPKEEKKKLNVVLNNPTEKISQSKLQSSSQPTPSQAQYIPPPTVASAGKFAPFKPRQASKPIPSTPFVPSSPIPEPNIQISLLTETVVRKKINEPIVTKVDQENVIVVNTQEGQATYDCIDPYDPSKPNDYLKYCEERFEKKRQKQVEEDNRKAIVEAERMRDAVEKERAKAMEEGDLARVQASLVGSGRGRGRGMTNLPAWLTDSMKSDSTAERYGASSQFGQFDDPVTVTDPSFRKRKPSFDSTYS
jgi:hypothetical protein